MGRPSQDLVDVEENRCRKLDVAIVVFVVLCCFADDERRCRAVRESRTVL